MKWITTVIVAVTVGAAVVATAQAIGEPLGKLLKLVDVNTVPPGWTKVTEIDLTKGDECPGQWEKIIVNGVSMCRSPSNSRGCYSAVFHTNGTTYTKIHGIIRGYQKGTTDAFEPYRNNPQYTIDDTYVDGVSITLATSPRKHVWTFASGVSSNADFRSNRYTCPCSPVQGPDSPPFIGEDYFCASGNQNTSAPNDVFYTSNPLWDGTVCTDHNDLCCDYFGLPWFIQKFCENHKEDIEVRICTDQSYSDEAVLINKIALYIQ